MLEPPSEKVEVGRTAEIQGTKQSDDIASLINAKKYSSLLYIQ